MGTEIPGGRGRGRLYLRQYYHHQNDPCIKMGGDESRFSVSLIVKGKVTRQRPQTTTLKREDREPRRNQTEVLLLTSLTPLPLGQTGSLYLTIVQQGFYSTFGAKHAETFMGESARYLTFNTQSTATLRHFRAKHKSSQHQSKSQNTNQSLIRCSPPASPYAGRVVYLVLGFQRPVNRI